VTVTRTNPATGAAVAEHAIVRTRADGGLVLQTSEGSRRCAAPACPRTLTFERVPPGLSAQPVFSVDTRDRAAGPTRRADLPRVGLRLAGALRRHARRARDGRRVKLRLMSWLTLLNDNGQSFPDAELLVVAARSTWSAISRRSPTRPTRGRCADLLPAGQHRARHAARLSAAVSAAAATDDGSANRSSSPDRGCSGPTSIASSVAVTPARRALGDLKLYRVPVPVTCRPRASSRSRSSTRTRSRDGCSTRTLCALERERRGGARGHAAGHGQRRDARPRQGACRWAGWRCSSRLRSASSSSPSSASATMPKGRTSNSRSAIAARCSRVRAAGGIDPTTSPNAGRRCAAH
jgi:hypothetical protein